MSRSPKDNILSTYYKRHRTKKKEKEKSGPIFIYNVSSLLPVNKHLAVEYKIKPSAASCRHNSEVAAKQGRRDLHQIWKLLEEFMDERLKSDADDMESGVPWAHSPLGRPMIQSIMRHYATIGDFQTLSMIVCMFPYETPQLAPERPAFQLPLGLQRSSSSIKMGTSPASSLSGRSPPDRSFLGVDTDALGSGWTTPRRRADSHNEVLERHPSTHVVDPEIDLQKHKAAIQILDPEHGYLYDFYKTTYADLLYRWSMLNERAILMKTMVLDMGRETPAVAIKCGTCKERYSKSWCTSCSKNNMPALQCAMCRACVKGPATVCVSCRHGGHLQHLRRWFEMENECPTGCGCHCLEHSAVE